MKKHQIIIIPRDLLYFRDGKAVNDASTVTFPLPGTFFGAIKTALHVKWKTKQPFEDEVHFNQQNRFSSLHIEGPFITKGKEIYFPTPLDLSPNEILSPCNNMPGISNLPSPLRYPVYGVQPASKERVSPWISLTEMVRYLNGEKKIKTVPALDFYDSEMRTGISIDKETLVINKHIFYQTSYLRLKENVSFCVNLSCDMQQTDVIEHFFAHGTNVDFTLGGQRGLATMSKQIHPLPMNIKLKEESVLVKWVLLTPAAFLGGVIPDFVDHQTGEVMLKSNPPKKENFISRKTWRMHIANLPNIKAKLVSICSEKPIAWSGWNMSHDCDEGGGSPDATKLLVPAGSVYYFEAENKQEAQSLINRLQLKCSSGMFAEQGFGFGVCTHFTFNSFVL